MLQTVVKKTLLEYLLVPGEHGTVTNLQTAVKTLLEYNVVYVEDTV
jgi:hypothetical protein